MRSRVLYKLILVPQGNCRVSGLPKGQALEKALPGCVCSDLFVEGFSYKRLDLSSGFTDLNDEGYRILKQLKGAKYIADFLRQTPPEELIRLLRRGDISLRDGYIGHSQTVSLAVRPAPLPEGDKRSGLELRKGSRFVCYIKTEDPTFPPVLDLGECSMQVLEVCPVALPECDRYVLQSDLPLTQMPKLEANSTSRFKLTYDPGAGCLILCAGSRISQKDHFGDGVML